MVEVIDEHSFEKSQTSIEAEVLYDADKIELVSISRWQYAFQTYDDSLITLEERDRYISEWNRRMPLLIGNLHYKVANDIFKSDYDLFINWLKSIGRWQNNLFV